MNRHPQLQVGLREEQLIGINALTITIHRSWIRKIKKEFNKIPKYILLNKENNNIHGKLLFKPNGKKLIRISTTGSDNQTYYFQIPKLYFNIFPVISKGRFKKIICNVELSHDMQNLWWYPCSSDRIEYLHSNKKPTRLTYIKKIDKTTSLLNKMLILSFIDIQKQKRIINQELKRLKALDPIFKELILL